MNNQWFSKVAVWLVIALVLFTVFKQFNQGATQGNSIGYSDFLEEVRSKHIKSVTLQEGPRQWCSINLIICVPANESDHTLASNQLLA